MIEFVTKYSNYTPPPGAKQFILQRLIILMAFHRELNITPGTEHIHHRLKETAYLGG